VKEEDKKKKSVAFKAGITSSRISARARLRRKNQVMKNAPMMIVMMKH
jgi:hypothetical protein